MAFIYHPGAGRDVYVCYALALILLFVVAVLIELRRRQQQRVRDAEAQWQRVERVFEKKDILEHERAVVREMLRRWAAEDPLNAVTVRDRFDACVEAELAETERGGGKDAFDAMGALLRDIRTRLGLDFVHYGQSIHSTRELTPGHPVLIAPVSEDKPPWFWTRVVAVDEAHFSLIRDAERAGLRPSLEAGDAVRCYTWREDDARYLFTTPLLRFDSDPAQWVLHHTADLERIQSREYYRLHIQQETRIRIVGVCGGRDRTVWQDRPVTAHFEGEIVNLSGGGVALLGPQTVPVQTVLRVTVKLPGEEPFEVHVEVADAQRLDECRHVLRCRFLDIVEDDRDRIIHYVSQRQMLLLAGDEQRAGEEQ